MLQRARACACVSVRVCASHSRWKPVSRSHRLSPRLRCVRSCALRRAPRAASTASVGKARTGSVGSHSVGGQGGREEEEEEERTGSRCSLSCVFSHFYGMSKDFQSSPCESLGADRCIVAFMSAPYFLCSVYPVCFFSLVPLILSQCLVLLFHSALCEPHTSSLRYK